MYIYTYNGIMKRGFVSQTLNGFHYLGEVPKKLNTFYFDSFASFGQQRYSGVHFDDETGVKTS